MASELKLERSIERWRNMKPSEVMKGSPAQVAYALEDARKDILALAAALNTPVAPVSPDATGKCGELVTVGYMVSHEEGLGTVEEPVCFRSQAEELLAAERANCRKVIEDYHTLATNASKRADDLEADNAALTAEISAISGHLDCEADSDSILHTIREIEADKAIYKESAEALEAKLAAAEKVLEPFAEYCGDHFDKDFNGNPLPDEQKVGWVYLNYGHFRKARAALGGKPSC